MYINMRSMSWNRTAIFSHPFFIFTQEDCREGRGRGRGRGGMGGCIIATRSIDGRAFSLLPSSTAARRRTGFSSLPAWKCSLDLKPHHRLNNRAGVNVSFRYAAAGMALALSLWVAPSSSIAASVDVVKTYSCLLKECRVELARCIIDPGCASNLACIESCNGRPDDAECQIGCGNLFQNSVVDQFNQCVVSRKKCVSQRPDDGAFPAPSLDATVKSLKLSDFDGEWYISSGLNPTFDIFDCQLHNFSSSDGKLTGNLTWRVRTPDDGFISRIAVQNFVQDSKYPGLLYNHNNELLHYQEDWYILSAKIENEPDDYIFVYYCGKNDAWSAYGGAVVYTRTQSLPPTIIPHLEEAAQKAGLDFSKFQATDNSCKPQPPLLARLGKRIEIGEEAIVRGVRELEEKVSKVWD